MIFKSHMKLSVLKNLKNKDQTGYDLITSIGEFGGKKPSAGYIYPLLKELEEKNFLTLKSEGRRKIYLITPKGKTLLENMQKNHDEMLNNMISTIGPIAEKGEMEKYVAFQSRLQKYKNQMLRDIDILDGFHKAMYKIYDKNDPSSRKKLRDTIKESTKKLERISGKNNKVKK